MIKKQLAIFKDFQSRVPHAHVGGSIGLFLHGINLQRDLRNADLDITVKHYLTDKDLFGAASIDDITDFGSSITDFDYSYRANNPGANGWTKMDIRVTPEPSFDVIHYEGFDYNVSKLENILFWKKKFANKGMEKHRLGLLVIAGANRTEVTLPALMDDLDDLPF